MNKKEVVNLDISSYSFQEILDLFGLGYLENRGYNISIDDMKQTKKKVLMLHPDKSNLSPEYFIFYKKAYDILLKHYEETNKINVNVSSANTDYKVVASDYKNDSIQTSISQVLEKTSTQKFNKKFNETFNSLFEKLNEKKTLNRNEWFSKEESIFETPNKVNASNINGVFENLKTQQQKKELILHKEFNSLYSTAGNVKITNLYEDDDSHDDNTDHNSTYISSNPFDKLKYEDLRKVHKDETIFSVGEKDLNKTKTYNSIEDLKYSRNIQNIIPIEYTNAEAMLKKQKEQLEKNLILKKYESDKKTEKNTLLSNTFLSSFLQLT
jgi:hypothetical protein